MILVPDAIYIAGPITGRPNYFAEFAAVAAELSSKGNIVFNPATLPEGLSWSQYMPICFAMMDACNTAYFLRGWERSKGARLEFSRATKRSMRIIFEGGGSNA